MSRRILSTLALLLVATTFRHPAAAQDSEPFRRRFSYEYVIHHRELSDVTARIETDVISPSMVQTLGQHRLSVNNHFYDLEIVEAATIKTDGRRVDVPRDKIVELSGAESSTNILFQADVKTHVIPFPELAAGDRTILTTRLRQKRPTVAGGFSRVLALSPAQRAEEINVTVDAPRDLKLHVTERAVQHTREERGERTLLKWSVPRQSYAADEAGSVALVDWAPMLAFSTYESWDVIGRETFRLADPKSQPTEAVDKLAEEITRGITDRRQQAAAIYDWVAKNIRYFLVILGQGGWEPHDTASILSNRYGDCKDHTTLMRALLRAKGIEFEFVLINQQRVYKAYEVPVLGFDHMIIYLPEFDLYADPTVAVGSFDTLPGSLADKPVLRVGSKATTVARTPAPKAEQYTAHLTSEATVQADGTIVGRNSHRDERPGCNRCAGRDAAVRTARRVGSGEAAPDAAALGGFGDVRNPLAVRPLRSVRGQIELHPDVFDVAVEYDRPGRSDRIEAVRASARRVCGRRPRKQAARFSLRRSHLVGKADGELAGGQEGSPYPEECQDLKAVR